MDTLQLYLLSFAFITTLLIAFICWLYAIVEAVIHRDRTLGLFLLALLVLTIIGYKVSW